MVVMRRAIQLMLSMLLLFKLERRRDWSLFFLDLKLLPRRPLPGKEEEMKKKSGGIALYSPIYGDQVHLWRPFFFPPM
jgi:hypothetical protein